MTDKLIIVTGPTASGKSDIAIELAKTIGGEIISADSQQVYRHMDIGTNKTQDLEGISHHMLDIIDPNDTFSVEDFSNRSKIIIKEIIDRGNIPIVAGGTGFYIDSLLSDMNYGSAPRDENIRNRLEETRQKMGDQYLYDKLKKLDPITADKYHPNETNRIIRALEIYELTGKLPSEVRTGEKELNKDIDPLVFFLNYNDRSKLYEKINNRVIEMISHGLIEEFVDLVKTYNLTESSQSMAAIGYKEVFLFIKCEIDIDQLIDLIQKNTRHYAKRQITWMKRYLDYGFTHEIKMDNLSKTDAADIIISIVKEVYEL